MGRWILWLAGMSCMGLVALVAMVASVRAVDFGATGKLSPGQKEGTFAFSYSSKIKFAQEGAFPVHVVLYTDRQVPVVDLVVQDGATFTLSANLAPGGYQIRSEVLPEKEILYWHAPGPSFFINSEGGIRYLPAEDSLTHVKKLQILTPNSQHLTNTSRSGMTVRWAPLRGASRYHLSWAEQILPGHDKVDSGAEDTPGQEFLFTSEVHMNRRYEFSIYAFDANGRTMGYAAPFYTYTVGAQKVKESKVTSSPLIGPSAPDKPKEQPSERAPEIKTATTPKGAPFFGVRPQPVAGVGQEGRGGLRVAGIGFDSPASKAGLKLDDVMTNFNGVPLSQATTVDEFTALVRSVPPGAKVLVEFYRKNVRMIAEVTITAKR